ncbi:Voltage-gated Ion Channel (VIC) Superfamily [Phytophthora cinnamomi]|uniref:Voltage-gated Ion Channel (VIC) Superfamily n=1 Tax=Phytophthora cinnamomi TaxID=4785 RepID=UPI003559A156|nr:Voltage-gated Ion Channel (VIC) Superfamily [Phytophthora cinnamomi]
MRALQLPLYEGEVVYFRDVILAMSREMIITVLNNWALGEELRNNIYEKSAGGSSRRRLTGFYGHEYFAAIYLQRRDKKLKKKHSGSLVLAVS